ncbi:group I truncated hemoglobin [Motilibacter aurantiacus]|uniref:group I truncated hemoglobin n=1 Tax=Motilibacter aurantiacus TaxID=2714955 RepID=UPI00140CA475|nr:group 1 truncated hemoglobin [Motilibacter aurantiacus]NHC45322.1 group 1 truncated hemoglobin [Motilibacter aurantiacus]
MTTRQPQEQGAREPTGGPHLVGHETRDSLYDRLGGARGLATAVTVFYSRVAEDPLLAPWFADVDLRRLRAHQHAFLTSVVGGPDVFTGRSPAAAHAGLAVTGTAFDAIVEHLAATLRDLDLDPEAVADVVERVESLRGEVVEGS